MYIYIPVCLNSKRRNPYEISGVHFHIFQLLGKERFGSYEVQQTLLQILKHIPHTQMYLEVNT